MLLETLYPLLWVLFGSLKTKQNMLENIWGPPLGLEFQNYADAWRIAQMGSRILNSVFVTGSALTILIAVATPCAYAVARLRFRGRGVVVATAVAAMLVPPQVMAIPLFMVARDLGLINSRLGISVIYAATSLPLSVFILRSFFLTLPADLEDAARIDGASRLTILIQVMLPLIRPVSGSSSSSASSKSGMISSWLSYCCATRRCKPSRSGSSASSSNMIRSGRSISPR